MQRTFPKFFNLVVTIDIALKDSFFPALFGGEEVNTDLRKILGRSIK